MRKKYLNILWILLPFVLALICIGLGRYRIGIKETIEVLLAGIEGNENVDAVATSVIYNIRMPRILTTLAVGGGLAVAGAAFQGLFTNPLATPDTLGVAKGASLGAVLAILFGQNMIVVQIAALIFGLVTVAITCNISRSKGKNSMIMIIMSGIVVGELCQAMVSLVKYAADPEDTLPAITYWLLGSFAGITYKTFFLGIPFIIIGSLVIFFLRWRINILTLSEDEAKSMGARVKVLRMALIVAATLITASSVSMCGQVGWVGLLVPHAARMIYGNNNRYVIPASISLGACFMVLIDTLARTATAAELPISVLTAVIGAPFFVSLLRKTGGVQL